MLKVIKRFVKVVRMSLCHHKFVLMDTEFNKVSLRIGCGYLWYRCPKCGKTIRRGFDNIRHRDHYHGWHEVLKNKM